MDTSQKLMEESQTNASLLQLVDKLKKDAKRAEEQFEHDLVQTQSTFEEQQQEKEDKIALLEKEANAARGLQVELNSAKSKLAEVYYKEDKNVKKTKSKHAEVEARDDDGATIDEGGFFEEVAEHGWIDMFWQACDSSVFSSDTTFCTCYYDDESTFIGGPNKMTLDLARRMRDPSREQRYG
mmetsp:Transcript_11933/g.21526  ORF Transcript_11933/g.21526 Transcript_11933/m.21526 type:complete len:182 (+) Transcript_11933:81-626(+)